MSWHAKHLPAEVSAEIVRGICATPGFFLSLTGEMWVVASHTWLSRSLITMCQAVDSEVPGRIC